MSHNPNDSNIEDKEKEFKARSIKLGLNNAAAEAYIKNQMHLYKLAQRQKAEEEAQLLGKTMQQLLPEIFEDKRAIPNSFLRGALFGMVRKGRRALVDNMPIFTMSQYQLNFTGHELDQNDLELWDTLIFLARNRNIENELRITLYDLCQQLRITDNNINRETVIKRIERLKIGTIKLSSGGRIFFGSLINNGYIDKDSDGKVVIEYNKKLAPLFADGDYTLISADIRHLLGDNQLARWLYNFYESHKKPIPFTIEFIQKLCKSGSSSKDFKYKLKIALAEVKKAHLSVNANSPWDYEITDNNYLLIYPQGAPQSRLAN